MKKTSCLAQFLRPYLHPEIHKMTCLVQEIAYLENVNSCPPLIIVSVQNSGEALESSSALFSAAETRYTSQSLATVCETNFFLRVDASKKSENGKIR